ncbi:Dyp-type peroxidase [Actinacidiphila yeochonensis]|uniref:Dyp-type peroxidase n=1 Tax=Actinacidiphila yeochonensis TaxID=89050 RepID=UPI0007C641BF|nr:Dyp-type peroxidase [Actinacidiphila yeochonensis]
MATDPLNGPEEPEPQAVVGPLSAAAVFTVATVDPGGEEKVRALLPELAGLVRAYGFGSPDAALSCVTGIGSDAWDRLFDAPRPASLHPFPELKGPRHTAPATPGDLLFHLRAERLDLCFALVSEILERLRGAVTVQDEVQGFRFLDRRDLLGFVDGTENPVGAGARAAVLVGAEDPEHAGGSYVHVQKYLHAVADWNTLPVEAQERIIGRTKAANVELDAGASHVALTTVTGPDGGERDILRDNMPFGSPGRGEFGTYFIGYSRDPGVTEQMLRNMFLGTPDATHDRILDFSTAVTGALFFVPSADFLDDPPPAASAGAPAEALTGAAASPAPAPTVPGSLPAGPTVPGPAPEPPAPARRAPAPPAAPGPARCADGSLGIGSLNRRRHS